MLKHLSLQQRLNLVVGILFTVGILALSILLITIHTQNAELKFQLRYERLTELMSEAIAPGIHLKIGSVIGKKLESYVNASEEFLASLLVVGLDGKVLYEKQSDTLTHFDLKTLLKTHPEILQAQELYVEFKENHLIVAQPAVLASTEVKGFTLVAWSTHSLNTEQQQSILLAAIAFGVIMVITLFILSRIIKKEVNSMTKLIGLLKSLAEGGNDFTRRLEITGHDEIGQMAYWFNRMLSNLQTANDTQQWFITGQTGVHEQLRGDEELTTILQKTINYIAGFLKAQVGVFYIMEDNRLKLMSSYAYKVRSANYNEFGLGEGLVGQAALEQESILFTRPPQEHVQTAINTGIGEILPDTILVLPLIHQDQVIGVLELGTTGTFTESCLEFLDSIADSVAISLYSAQSRRRLKELLEKTQAQSERLQNQQEELQATNEELEEQTKILRKSEKRLQEQQEEIRVSNEELATKTKALEAQQAQTQTKNQELEAAQKELEEKAKALEKSNKYKSEFLANMSHELRTPLNSLLLLADSLASNKMGNLTKKQIQFAETIHHSGEELLQLINEILDLSKVESGKLEITLENYEVRGLKNYIERNFQQVVDQKGLKLKIEIEETIPPTFTTDAQRLEQILKNFVSNAIKFTDRGQVTVHIGYPDPYQVFLRDDLLPQKAIAFSVSDTGMGISPEKQDLIFEAFQQADGSTSRKYGGTGLGLSISKELAKLLGGEILVHSVEGQGSTFTLCLPIRDRVAAPSPRKALATNTVSVPAHIPASTSAYTPSANAAPPAANSARLASATSMLSPPAYSSFIPDDRNQITDHQKRTLLVIEDDPRFSQIVMDLAHEKGFQFLAAESGEEGIQLAHTYQPDAIILDIGLPQTNGWEVMEQLKKSLQTSHIPVHFISASDKDTKAMQMGAIGFLTKPVNQESLEMAFQKIEDTIAKNLQRVLIVEDDAGLQLAIQELTLDMDLELIQTETAEEAQELIKNQSFDCIVLDLRLKNMSGEELLQKIHADPSLTLPPIIVYTGKPLSREDEKSLEQYAESIILKGAKSLDRLVGELHLFLDQIEPNPPEKPGPPSSSHHDESNGLQGKVVLLADDDSRNSFALSHHLEEHGLVVQQAFDGKEALETLEAEPHVDIVLTDIMMPEMDGYETIQAIRAQERFKDLPIIALTAKAMKEDRHKCIAAGASDYLSKPVDIDKLLSLLKVWVAPQ